VANANHVGLVSWELASSRPAACVSVVLLWTRPDYTGSAWLIPVPFLRAART
jgi:hypothetical protein